MINIYLTASPKNETHKEYIRKYVTEQMAKRLKIKENQIKIFDILEHIPVPIDVKNTSFYYISQITAKMAYCDFFVVFKTYLFDVLPEQSRLEHNLWCTHELSDPITIWELD